MFAVMSASLEEFEAHRARLLRIAFRMLGSMSEAEDVVQDTYLRWHESDRSDVRALAALLVRIVVRLAIDRQRRLKTERASYLGSWLPEPWAGESLERADDMSYATLVLLERLSADERAAFLLREVFDYDYDVIADSLDKAEAACRKLVQRAKERLVESESGYEPKQAASREARTELLTRLMAATRAQSAEELERLLAPSGRLVSDGGGKVFAARYAVQGRAKVARTLWRFYGKWQAGIVERLVALSGEPALITELDGKLWAVSFVAADERGIQALYMVRNPEKIRRVEALLSAP
jgi:RNA polymerase sigma-70 factor, ECF subfamily